jgi:PAS domain S-box-containing protein
MAGERILIVENEPGAANSLASSLTSLGYAVAGSAGTGEEALFLLAKAPPALVLVDVNLPGPMSGIECARTIRRQSDVPVVFLTPGSDSAYLARGRSANPFGYLPIPCQPATLHATIGFALFKAGMEKKLAESEEKYRDLYETAPNAYFSVSATGEVLSSNAAAVNLLGHGRATLSRMRVHDLFHTSPEGAEAARAVHSRWLAGEPVRDVELPMRHADGTPVWVSLSVQPVRDEAGKVSEGRMMAVDITKRKLAQQKLRDQEELFSKVFYLSPLPIAITKLNTGCFARVNEAFASFLGGSLSDYPGLPAETIWDDAEKQKGFIRQIREKGSFQGVELSFSSSSGDTRDCLVSAEIVEIGGEEHLLSMAVDITDRKTAEESLNKAHQQLRAIFDTFPGAVNVVDTSRNILDLSESLRRLYGLSSREGALGKKCHQVYRGREAPCPDCSLERVMQSGELVTRMISQDHETFMGGAYKAYTHPIKDENGQIWGAVECVMDVTDLFKAEEQARAALEEKEALLREVHHRVKNNFLVIIGLLDLQAAYITHDPTLAMFREIQERIRAMALVHQRLYQSRSLAKVDFGAYLHEMTANLFHLYGADPARVSLNILAQDIHLSVDTAVPCGMIVNELVTNSLKYAFDPRQCGEIQVGVLTTGPVHTLWVADNGKGLPPDFDITRCKSFGMRLVTILARQLGGSLRLDQSLGTRITVTFVENEKQRSGK